VLKLNEYYENELGWREQLKKNGMLDSPSYTEEAVAYRMLKEFLPALLKLTREQLVYELKTRNYTKPLYMWSKKGLIILVVLQEYGHFCYELASRCLT
jgi:hypothetical protein